MCEMQTQNRSAKTCSIIYLPLLLKCWAAAFSIRLVLMVGREVV